MMTTAQKSFHVTLTADFYNSSGVLQYKDIGLALLDNEAQIPYSTFAENRLEIGADQLAGSNGAIVLMPKVTAATLAQAEDLLAIGRFGVGYDSVDVPACTAADVVLFITPSAVSRPVAEATVGWMIALTHHMRIKDQLLRAGQWQARSRYMGCE